MSIFKNGLKALAATAILVSLNACKDDDGDNVNKNPNAAGRYVLGIGVQGADNVTHYVVQTDDLMNGTINAVGNGLEQSGYRDFSVGNNTLFSVGGLGVSHVNGITINAEGKLSEKGNFVFDNTLSGLIQANDNEMLGTEFGSASAGDAGKFYIVDINGVSIKSTVPNNLNDLVRLGEMPIYTGSTVRDDKAFVTYYLTDPNTYATQYTDTNYVAVYSYPEMQFEKMIKDTRTGPSGAFGTQNGIFQTENGDMYVMSSSNIANGYSQSTKPGGFLKISNGSTDFDPDYFFNVDEATGGHKISHVKYIGNGLAFAEITTASNPSQWSDSSLKTAIIDLGSQTINYVEDIPLHDGMGGRSFAALVDDGMIYFPITTEDGTHIWRVNPTDYSATKGAMVEGSYVGGIFKL